MTETEADIVRELRPGMYAWFADDTGEGYREVKAVLPRKAEPRTWNYDLASDWVTVTYTDGHSEDRVRYGTHEIWLSGPRPMVGTA